MRIVQLPAGATCGTLNERLCLSCFGVKLVSFYLKKKKIKQKVWQCEDSSVRKDQVPRQYIKAAFQGISNEALIIQERNHWEAAPRLMVGESREGNVIVLERKTLGRPKRRRVCRRPRVRSRFRIPRAYPAAPCASGQLIGRLLVRCRAPRPC